MGDRFFSDSVQYQAVLSNLEKNNGQMRCSLCHRILTAKSECHFDHIVAYSKGGKSTLENCQILCMECNLSKSDKEMRDFILEEKARRFFAGETIVEDLPVEPKSEPLHDAVMSKERFDDVVGEFIKKHGNIKKVDFTRDKNGLPSITYVTKYYGSMNELKFAFGLEIDTVWDRDSIWSRLLEYSRINPEFRQSDLKKENGLPSLPCILAHFPEYKNFNKIRSALGLCLNYEVWTKKAILAACREYLKTHSKITQRDLKKENGLPTTKVIYNHFGTMMNFQREIGSEISDVKEYISKEKILEVTKEIIKSRGATFASRCDFLDNFPYSLSVIINRFGSFDSFVNHAGISIISTKKAKYTKQEVDNAIISYLKAGNDIPSSAKQLSSLSLPSSATILRFYDSWKEPFLIFLKMLNITSK